MNEIQESFPTWMTSEGTDQDVVLFTKFSLSRNSEEFAFPHRIDNSDLPNLFMRSEQAAKKIYNSPQGHALSEDWAEILIEELYINQELLSIERRIILETGGNNALLINGKDHFMLMDNSPGFSPVEQFERLKEQDEILEEFFNYATSIKLGYLLSRIDRSGSGLHVDVFLHLPALSTRKQFAQLIARAQRNGFHICSFGNRQQPFGHLFQLSSDAGHERTEQEFLEKLISIVQEFVLAERMEQTAVLEEGGIEFVDHLWRSFATLGSCRILSLREGIDTFSLVRLGSRLKIFPFHTVALPVFLMQPAHLRMLANNPLFSKYKNLIKNTNKSLEVLRAAAIRTFIKEYSMNSYKEASNT